MRRWNGWGEEHTEMALAAKGTSFLQDVLGAGQVLPLASLDSVIKQVPPSRLPAHPLISTDPELRVRHARGQSLADWLAMRSGQFERFPDAVALPESAEQIRELLAFAKAQDALVIPYGGGTSVAGHINPPASVEPVLTLSLSRMNRLLELDKTSNLATFGPGANGPQVESQLRAQGYTLGHFPQSFELATVGGWIASRSSGQQSLGYGRIEQLFAGGRLETFDGTLEIKGFPASAAGPDLRELVLGSEGRFGVLSEVKMRVSRLPAAERFYAVFLPNWQQALPAVRELVQAKVPLSMLRLSNAAETTTQLKLAGHPAQIAWLERYLRLRGISADKCMLLLGVSGHPKQLRASLVQAKTILKAYGAVWTSTVLGKIWERGRFRFPYLRETLWQAGYLVDTLETVIDWSGVARLLNAVESSLRDGLKDENEPVHVFTHLSHLYGSGSSIYTSYLFRPGADYSTALARWQKLKQAASEAIVREGGSISHHHGVGRDHAPYLASEKGERGMAVLQTLAKHFDPKGRLNPGALLPGKGQPQ